MRGLSDWTFTENSKKLARQNGGRLYFGGMLMAHVFEALSIIKDIQDGAKLMTLVDACDPQTLSSFNAVAAFLKTDDYRMLCRRSPTSKYQSSGSCPSEYIET
jgi:hypothetical protein